MAPLVDNLDLSSLRLSSGEGRRLTLAIDLDPFELGSEHYAITPEPIESALEISRTMGSGYVLRLRFEATLEGPCMRCLEPAARTFAVDVREVSQPGEEDDFDSPYVDDAVLDLKSWANDSLALTLPRAILCRDDCAGLCAKCGIDLNHAGPEHYHEPEPDPRWAKLSELKFDTEAAD